MVEARIVTVDIRTNHVDGRRKGTPQPDEFLNSSSARVLNTWNGYLSLWQLRSRIADPDVDVARYCKLLFARRCDFVDIFLPVINLEDLICIGPEDLAPVPGCLSVAARRSAGTGPANSRFASAEKSRTLPTFPDSFSTCTMRTVCWSLSISFRWRISAVNATLSASSVLRDIGDNTSIGSPSGLMIRG